GVNAASQDVTLLLGNGDATLAPGVAWAAGPRPTSAAVADVDGDRRLDVVVGNQLAGTVTLLPGRGDGTFGAPTTVTIATSASVVAVLAVDVNGDEVIDLVATTGFELRVLLGIMGGGYQAPITASIANLPDATARSLAAADFNRDGLVDVAAGTLKDVQLFAGNGKGAFARVGRVG